MAIVVDTQGGRIRFHPALVSYNPPRSVSPDPRRYTGEHKSPAENAILTKSTIILSMLLSLVLI